MKDEIRQYFLLFTPRITIGHYQMAYHDAYTIDYPYGLLQRILHGVSIDAGYRGIQGWH